MPGMYEHVLPAEQFCQGDILQIFDDRNFAHHGVVVTADCDLAQNKFGDHISYLPIVSVESYIDRIWARSELEKQASLSIKNSINALRDADRVRDPNVATLHPDELIDWLEKKSPDQIVSNFQIRNKQKINNIISDLEIVSINQLAIKNSKYIKGLLSVWELSGLDDKKVLAKLKSALTVMRQEFFYVPTIPESAGIGHIVLLRDLRPIHHAALHTSQVDFRLTHGEGVHGVRVGRFLPYLKYSVVQRLANLFARIGLENDFEDECEASIDFAIEGAMEAFREVSN